MKAEDQSAERYDVRSTVKTYGDEIINFSRAVEAAHGVGVQVVPLPQSEWPVLSDEQVTERRERAKETLRNAGVPSVHDRLAQAMKLHGPGPFVDAVLAECPDAECHDCGRIVCPHGEPMHFHHDGCPACAQHDAGVDARAGPLSADEASAMFSRSIGARPIDGRRLYSFLEPGDVIQPGDEFYNDGTWVKAGGYLVGNPYESFHFLARRPAAGVADAAKTGDETRNGDTK